MINILITKKNKYNKSNQNYPYYCFHLEYFECSPLLWIAANTESRVQRPDHSLLLI